MFSSSDIALCIRQMFAPNFRGLSYSFWQIHLSLLIHTILDIFFQIIPYDSWDELMSMFSSIQLFYNVSTEDTLELHAHFIISLYCPT